MTGRRYPCCVRISRLAGAGVMWGCPSRSGLQCHCVLLNCRVFLPQLVYERTRLVLSEEHRTRPSPCDRCVLLSLSRTPSRPRMRQTTWARTYACIPRPIWMNTDAPNIYKGRIPRHRHRHLRGDPRENIGVGVVECGLNATHRCIVCTGTCAIAAMSHSWHVHVVVHASLTCKIK